jgi:glutamate-ammonia-ligase adenylyltransferase
MTDNLPCHWQQTIGALPDLLQDLVSKLLQRLPYCDWPDDANLRQAVVTMLAASDYVAHCWQRYPQWVMQWWQNPALQQSALLPMTIALDTTATQPVMMQALRRQRHEYLCAIAWRDIMGWADIRLVLAEQSHLADQLINAAYHWVKQRLMLEYQVSACADLIILTLGKLGGHELNFSSDVDLIFAYPDSGFTAELIDAQQFYTRLGQQLIGVLDQPTADGFVYRVDMRLRPFGQSGPLVMKVSALLRYYQEHGRDWERYAMIKARAITGDSKALLQQLQAFCYRPYVDFNMRLAIRTMHDMISRETARKRLHNHIKLGPGGIREIEFIVQSYQLIYAGERAALKRTPLLDVLAILGKYHLLSEQQVGVLHETYLFWRRLENRVQILLDQQQHQLPGSALMQVRVVHAMHMVSLSALEQVITQARQQVRTLFDETTAFSDAAPVDGSGAQTSEWYDLLAAVQQKVAEKKCQPAIIAQLQRISTFLSEHQQAFTDYPTLVNRMSHWLPCLFNRSTYLTLLNEHLDQLVPLGRMMLDSPWLYQQLLHQPHLLSVMVQPKQQGLWGRERIAAELTSHQQHREHDEEALLEAMRHEKARQQVRIAIADLYQHLPIMRVSDYLTELAEVMLNQAEHMAWHHMVGRYGLPDQLQDHHDHGFGVIAYGKLGGIELSYDSDLDLVLLYQQAEGKTQGEKSLSHGQFYARMAQRLVHILQTRTYSGPLYKVDLQLRPSGNAGLLVCSVAAYERYQSQAAWTWEHQALLRARMVVGPARMREQFAAIRQHVLCQRRDEAVLNQAVKDMRERMRQHHYRAGEFDLKQMPGGLIDLEFLVQYWLLLSAHDAPQVVYYSDHIRQLQSLAQASVLREEVVSQLIDIYRLYRQSVHTLTVAGKRPLPADYQEALQFVTAQWHTVFCR